MKLSIRISALAITLLAVLLPVIALAQATTTPGLTLTAKQTGPVFTRNLVEGSVGLDVQRLQRYLNTHGCEVANSGIGSYQQETTYFGPLTKAALQCFQTDTGLITPTGNLGTLTRRYISTLP